MFRSLLVFICLSLPLLASAQGLKGLVVNGITGERLGAVTVTNLRTGQSAYTDDQGSFSIAAEKSDPIAFALIGFKTQQKTVPAAIGMAEMYIELFPLSFQLDEFTFRPRYTPYQLDSMERQSTYQRALAREKAGSVMSPVTLLADKLSRKSQQTYRFQKSFNYWETVKFVEYRYTPELVAQMTPLRGDTLAAFMNAHPLPYDFARVASDLELKMWIREQYKLWQQKPRYDLLVPPDSTSHE